MTCLRHFACLLCLGLLLPTLACSEADESVVSEVAAEEPAASETAADDMCEDPGQAPMPRVPSTVKVGKRMAAAAQKHEVVVLNTQGYAYDIPYREPAPAPVPAKVAQTE